MAENTTWFDTYKAEFFRTLLFNDHETFDHPIACEPWRHRIRATYVDLSLYGNPILSNLLAMRFNIWEHAMRFFARIVSPFCSSQRCCRHQLGLSSVPELSDVSRAGLVVLDSSEADPVAAAAELLRSAALPPLLKAGIMDSQQLLKHYLLLHDSRGSGDFKR